MESLGPYTPPLFKELKCYQKFNGWADGWLREEGTGNRFDPSGFGQDIRGLVFLGTFFAAEK